MTESELALALATPGSTSFRKSSFCAKDACVEVAFTNGDVLVRDGKDRQAPLLRFSHPAWSAFVGGLAAGEFDRA